MPGIGSVKPTPAPLSPHAASPAAAADADISFHMLLRELNPLQHIPVVGTLYRALTGDTIPDSARVIGSFVVGGLLGGPIGLATNLALYAVEQATGIDPERIGQRALAGLGIGHASGTAVAATTPPAASPLQLAAYGMTRHGMAPAQGRGGPRS